MKMKAINELVHNNLRLAIIEPTAEGQFSLIIAIETESYVVTNNDNTLYTRDTLEGIIADLAHCTIDDLLLHVNAHPITAPINRDLMPYIHIHVDNDSGYIPLRHTPLIH